MKVTGYQLREARKRWISRRDIAQKTFRESLWQFEKEIGLSPAKIAEDFRQADIAVARIETAQQHFNQIITVSIAGQTMTLSEAIKRVGGAARLATMWQAAATDNGRDKYAYRELVRKEGDIHAKRMIAPEQAIIAAEEAAKFASALRSEIATANARSMEIDIDAGILG